MKEIQDNIPFDELPFHLELPEDAVIFVTSDLKRIGLQSRANKQTIDAMAFLDNLQKVVCKGTIIVPTYTDYLKNGDTFDYLKSQPSTGALSKRVLKRKDFTRTTDPLHSVCVWGKYANEILQLKDESTFGKNSIFDFLWQKNALFLFFDVSIQQSFTFIHHVEEQIDVPYRRYKNWKIWIKMDGTESLQPVKFHTRKPGVISNVEALNTTLLNEGLMKRVRYGNVFIDKVTAIATAEKVKIFIQQKKYLYHFSVFAYFKTVMKRMLGR